MRGNLDIRLLGKMRAKSLHANGIRILRFFQEHPRLFSASLASFLIFLTFPDVFLAGTSLRITDQMWGFYEGLKFYRVHPLLPGNYKWWPAAYAEWLQSYNDFGGALWQSEPIMEFMRFCLWTLNSPYWNPYSSAGALGPETLIDMKFSVFTIAYAALGGGTLVYNILLLSFFWLGTYFVIRIVRDKLNLNVFGCAAAGIFYLLNGYSIGNIGSNVALSYLFVPACLYAAFAFSDQQTPRRFAFLAFGFAALLSHTFLPTTIMGVIAIIGCGAGYTLAQFWGQRALVRRGLTILCLYGLAVAAALGLLAALYLPFAESLPITGIYDLYTQRVIYHSSWMGALSLFTPSHFFRYSGMQPDGAEIVKNVIYYCGVLGLGLAACAWSVRPSHWRPLVTVCASLVIIALGRIFGLPGINDFIQLIPIIRNIGAQYLWVGVMIPMTLLIACGADNLRRGTAARIPVMLALGAGLAAGVSLALNFGLREPNVNQKALALLVTLLLAELVFAAVWIAPRVSAPQRAAITGIFVALLFVELALSAKWFRYEANDTFMHPTSDVVFLKSHSDHYRTMTFGAYAAPMERGAAYQIQEITSLNMGILPGYREYFDRLAFAFPENQKWGNFASLSLAQDAPHLDYFDWNAINLLGVKYIIVPKLHPAYLEAFKRNGFPVAHEAQFTMTFENRGVWPRAFTIDIANDPPGEDVTLPTLPNSVIAATITKYRNARVELAGSVERRRLVVLTDNWHPNWRALLNGQPAPIVRVNGTFRGVWVPAGDFKIQMSYQPRTLPLAIVISLATMVGLLVMLFLPARREIRKTTGAATASTEAACKQPKIRRSDEILDLYNQGAVTQPQQQL